MDPPVRGDTSLLWFGPALLVLLGGAVIGTTVYRARNRLAAEPVSRPEFRPYVADDQDLPELTLRALVLGSILGLVFGASSVYLGLRVGLTVSASIPIAVVSITIFRRLSRILGSQASILENNIVQTAG